MWLVGIVVWVQSRKLKPLTVQLKFCHGLLKEFFTKKHNVSFAITIASLPCVRHMTFRFKHTIKSSAHALLIVVFFQFINEMDFLSHLLPMPNI